jgi:hypothetical protein
MKVGLERVSRRVGGLILSGSGVGVEVEHPTAERPRHLHLACYSLGADAIGIPASLVTHRSRAQPWGHPGARHAGGTVGLRSIVLFGVNADSLCVRLPWRVVVCR